VTTILADARLGVIVADSCVSDDDRVWSVRKVVRSRGALIATAGDILQGRTFCAWWASGATEPPDFAFDDAEALVLDDSGLYVFDDNQLGLERVPCGRETIGTGGKTAIAVYEALRWQNPRRAVALACKYDKGSRPPVRVYKLRERGSR
jgi:hypothetical protein